LHIFAIDGQVAQIDVGTYVNRLVAFKEMAEAGAV
jgi:hypothetical protein